MEILGAIAGSPDQYRRGSTHHHHYHPSPPHQQQQLNSSSNFGGGGATSPYSATSAPSSSPYANNQKEAKVGPSGEVDSGPYFVGGGAGAAGGAPSTPTSGGRLTTSQHWRASRILGVGGGDRETDRNGMDSGRSSGGGGVGVGVGGSGGGGESMLPHTSVAAQSVATRGAALALRAVLAARFEAFAGAARRRAFQRWGRLQTAEAQRRFRRHALYAYRLSGALFARSLARVVGRRLRQAWRLWQLAAQEEAVEGLVRDIDDDHVQRLQRVGAEFLNRALLRWLRQRQRGGWEAWRAFNGTVDADRAERRLRSAAGDERAAHAATLVALRTAFLGRALGQWRRRRAGGALVAWRLATAGRAAAEALADQRRRGAREDGALRRRLQSAGAAAAAGTLLHRLRAGKAAAFRAWVAGGALGEAQRQATDAEGRHSSRLAEVKAAAALGVARGLRRALRAAARRRWRRWVEQCRGHSDLVASRKMLTRTALAERDHSHRLRGVAAGLLGASLARAQRAVLAARVSTWAAQAQRLRERDLRGTIASASHVLSEYRRAAAAASLGRALKRWGRSLVLPGAWCSWRLFCLDHKASGRVAMGHAQARLVEVRGLLAS